MDVVIVNLFGVGLIGAIVWYFWLSSSESQVATVTGTGIQETRIVVKGGYSPDTIALQVGAPVRLVFDRQEADPCSERVVIDAFGVSAELPTGQQTVVEFTPEAPGEYEFACQMGMLRGKLIVT
ncbi:MAG: cupredoxin domain-containing protein [Acidimicrobiia bacterium]|nr:cupredoxin domain-containing protein [Acidimicrobiia bacterium]NND13080.1 cupredoxin domain-containing protein [Acidimicrobiia bacterium]NNJ47900.1 cupredoxin domain-containing protein [Acidimicrobiia bacterium]NNL98045.1 cupredoxin domain-containing protein [Acidimicrobiia bacterium]